LRDCPRGITGDFARALCPLFPDRYQIFRIVEHRRFVPLTVIDAFDPERRKLAENGTILLNAGVL
jgi:hypothetical protein